MAASPDEETAHFNDTNDVPVLQKQIRELMARVAQLEAKQKEEGTDIIDSEEDNEAAPDEAHTDSPGHVPDIKDDERGSVTFIEHSSDSKDQLEISYKPLCELLRQLLAHYLTHQLYPQIVTLVSPFEPLIHNWDLLKQESTATPSNDEERIARQELRDVLDTLQRHKNKRDPRLHEYLSIREALIQSKSITFDSLWTIFPPGTIVYGQPCFQLHQIFIVESIERAWPDCRDKHWYLSCWTYDWNGQCFQRKPVTLAFTRFSGAKPITALPYYPLSAKDNCEEIKRSLRERGLRYRECCTARSGVQRFKYNGKAMIEKIGFSKGGLEADWMNLMREMKDAITEKQFEDEEIRIPVEPAVESDVMVDFEAYYKYGPGHGYIGNIWMGESADECGCNHCSNNETLGHVYCRRYDNAKGVKVNEATGEEEEEQWEDLQLMLCPPRVLGYILSERKWAQLEVDKLEETNEDRSAFNTRLHLKGESLSGDETKDLLLKLVEGHGKDPIADLTQEKGKGLVILLYGSPGVGKTSTAETIAAAAGKPLFRIGVADVGTEPMNVESNLKKVFSLAARWKAILLIDEVDVFVQSRAVGHQGPTTERNALVSVFLRVLEYFQGILILTTNQTAMFDIAIQSRIHIAIKYTELDREQVQKIFMQFLDQYNKRGLVEQYPAIAKFARNDLHKKGFDGRQLRNLVVSAMGLAQARPNGKMRMDDINIVMCNIESFKGDLAYQMRRYQELQSGSRGGIF